MAIRDGFQIPAGPLYTGFGTSAYKGTVLPIGDLDFNRGLFRGLSKGQRVMEVVKSKSFNVRVTMRHPYTGEGVAGLTLTVKIAKAGASSFSSVSRTVTDLGSGVYDIAFTSSDSDTVGPFSLLVTGPNVISVDQFDIRIVPPGREEFPSGVVVTDAGNTITSFKTNLVQVTLDYWRDAFIVMTSGNYKDQVKKIIGYDGTSKFITVANPGFTGTPLGGDTFDIINR